MTPADVALLPRGVVITADAPLRAGGIDAAAAGAPETLLVSPDMEGRLLL